MAVKYAVIPGYVHSKNDGDEHYITARELVKLYGVPPHKCRVFDERDKIPEGLIILLPDYTGKYEAPEPKGLRGVYGGRLEAEPDTCPECGQPNADQIMSNDVLVSYYCRECLHRWYPASEVKMSYIKSKK